jgi:hypothetical protein
MRPYRVRHIPSGLYYQPARGYRKSNLSKQGKVYLTGLNPLSTMPDYVYIQVDKESRVFGLVKSLFPLNDKGDILYKTPKEQFIIEELE